MEPIGWVTQIEPIWHGAPHDRLRPDARSCVLTVGCQAAEMLRVAGASLDRRRCGGYVTAQYCRIGPLLGRPLSGPAGRKSVRFRRRRLPRRRSQMGSRRVMHRRGFRTGLWTR